MKKLILFLLALVMLVSLTACGKDSEKETTGATESTGMESQPSESETQPSEETTEPATQPTESATQPTESATQPTEPATQPTESATQPTEPATQPTESATQPTEPATQPTESATQPTEPATQPTEPETQPTEPPHVHSYTQAVTAPDCTTGGYTTNTCACGDSYKSDEKAALGHSFADATCTAPKTCSACKITEGAAKGHSFADGKCTVCNEVDPSFKALETGCWKLGKYVNDDWVTHAFYFHSNGVWGQPTWYYHFQEPAAESTINDYIANGVDVEKYKHENGKYYLLGGGDSAPMTCTIDGDTITVAIYDAVITLKRTAGNQLTVENSNGNLYVGNYDIKVGDVFTWETCGHVFNEGKCDRCGEAQPNYKVLNTGIWTSQHVEGSQLYSQSLHFAVSDRIGVPLWEATLGVDINTLDPASRDDLLAHRDEVNLLEVDGVLYYIGEGGSDTMTYTEGGSMVFVTLNTYSVELVLDRTAGNQLTLREVHGSVSGAMAGFKAGQVFTWAETE